MRALLGEPRREFVNTAIVENSDKPRNANRTFEAAPLSVDDEFQRYVEQPKIVDWVPFAQWWRELPFALAESDALI